MWFYANGWKVFNVCEWLDFHLQNTFSMELVVSFIHTIPLTHMCHTNVHTPSLSLQNRSHRRQIFRIHSNSHSYQVFCEGRCVCVWEWVDGWFCICACQLNASHRLSCVRAITFWIVNKSTNVKELKLNCVLVFHVISRRLRSIFFFFFFSVFASFTLHIFRFSFFSAQFIFVSVGLTSIVVCLRKKFFSTISLHTLGNMFASDCMYVFESRWNCVNYI